MIKAIFWDFGGVILTSPFDAFRRYEEQRGLPADFLRSVNARNPDSNAWAQFERNDVSAEEFCRLFEQESAVLGHAVPGEDVLALLSGDVREEMVDALVKLKPQYALACLTNNVRKGDGPGMASTAERANRIAEVMTLFDHIVESSKVGVRKPEPKFYEMACEMAGVSAAQVVFLDDLGVNLKPARAMGMQTIKVLGPQQALRDLGQILQVDLI
ncbi:MAG: HAD-IA family hydrolase [Gammaproteobacteria bacterium]|nr:HAD-IA family hydrolase [Gammaproteobacteria bacterium]